MCCAGFSLDCGSFGLVPAERMLAKLRKGKPGLPRNAKFAEFKYQYIKCLKITKFLMRGTPGLPPLYSGNNLYALLKNKGYVGSCLNMFK